MTHRPAARAALACALSLLAAAAFAQPAAGRRVALVIGNGAYSDAPLANPPGDADLMGAALRKAGFDPVAVKKNLNKRGIAEAMDAFAASAQGAEAAVFYYSGHGAQLDNQNYLIPVDTKILKESDLEFDAYPVGRILADMEGSGAKANILILDACRNVPLLKNTKSAAKGLAAPPIPEGSAILYATMAGTVALDDSNFTRSLAGHLNDRGVSLMDLFATVTEEVATATGKKQVPSATSQIIGRFFFAPGARDFGNVQVSAKAGAQILVDGDARGKVKKGGSLLVSDVPSGETAITLQYDDGRSETIRALVSAGATIRIDGRFPAPEDIPAGLCFVAGGSFTMGDAMGGGEADEGPAREVTVSSFYLAKTEVTVAEFREFARASGYVTQAEREGGGYARLGDGWERLEDASWRNPRLSQGDRDPVVFVSWWDAVAYCNWRSAKEGLRSAYSVRGSTAVCDWSANGYRLPTEAEWEYAARAGAAKRATAPAASELDGAAWYAANSGASTRPVGEKRPNGYGLYDMTGNAWEWCWDWYAPAYPREPQADPRGPASGRGRVLRGGGWQSDAFSARATYRLSYEPGSRYNFVGFRIARSLPAGK